jgi:hypothetical protein
MSGGEAPVTQAVKSSIEADFLLRHLTERAKRA